MNGLNKILGLPVKKFNTPYEAGYDCGINGATIDNCDFRFFSSPENTAEWTRGTKDGEKSNQEDKE